MAKIKTRKPTGLIIYPHGTIEIQKLTVDSSVTWGSEKAKGADPAWLTPTTFRLSNKGKFAILPSLMLESVALPGERVVITSEERIQRAYKERYQYTMDHAQGIGRDEGSIWLMMITGMLTLGLVITMVALGLPQAIENFRS